MNNIINQIAIGVALAIAPVVSGAATWVADYSVNANVSYDDNFFMNQSEQDTVVYSVKPEVSLMYVSPVVKSQLDARIGINRYAEFDQFDSEDPAFDWKNTYKTERSNWAINIGYSENSQRDAAELDTGIFDSNSIVETIYVNPSVNLDITERDQLGVSLNYSERDYDTNDFSDNDNQTLGLNWEHRLNELISTTAMVSISQYDAGRVAISENETEYLQATIGFIYRRSEAMTINGSVGHFETDRRQRLVLGPALLILDSETTGALVKLGVSYSYEKDVFSFNLSRGLYPSSQGLVEERDSIGLHYEHQFNGRSASGINLYWHDTETSLEDRETFTLSPFYNYRLTEKLDLQTTYTFRRHDRQLTLTEVESNQIKVGLRYSF
jgi:hypothetical protein